MDPNRKVKSPGKIHRGLHRMTEENSRAEERGVKLFKISGRVQVIGDGECSFAVSFPVTFAERPGCSFGYELAENQIPIAGSFPVVSVGVASWDKIATSIPGEFHYTGAVITAVAVGNPHYLWVHWHVEGKAFQNPIDITGADPVV